MDFFIGLSIGFFSQNVIQIWKIRGGAKKKGKRKRTPSRRIGSPKSAARVKNSPSSGLEKTCSSEPCICHVNKYTTAELVSTILDHSNTIPTHSHNEQGPSTVTQRIELQNLEPQFPEFFGIELTTEQKQKSDENLFDEDADRTETEGEESDDSYYTTYTMDTIQ